MKNAGRGDLNCKLFATLTISIVLKMIALSTLVPDLNLDLDDP
jgi:hypothetical protein